MFDWSRVISIANQSASLRSSLVNRVDSLDAIRGIAALSVALFHYMQGSVTSTIPLADWLGTSAWLGVDAFFVVSGFIVPLAFYRHGTSPRDSSTFFARRLVRVAGPMLVASMLVLLLNFASTLAPGFRGMPWQGTTLPQVLCHFTYSCSFAGIPWYNPAFWTLAIEVQFYLLVALLLPLLVSRIGKLTVVVLAALSVSLAPVLHNIDIVVLYVPFFLLGTSAALIHERVISWGTGMAAFAMLFVIIALSLGLLEAFTGGITFAAIFLLSRPPHWMKWLGTVSYSLYLLHIPIGGRIIHLGARLDRNPFIDAVIICAAIALSLFAAWIFWRWVELPFQSLASSVGQHRQVDSVASVAAPARTAH